MKEYYPTLLKCTLFKGFSPVSLEKLLNYLSPTIKFYQKGEILLLGGYSNRNISIVLEGSAKGVRASFSGKENIIAIFNKGDIYGDVLSGSHAKSPITVTACEDCTILLLPYDKIISPYSENISAVGLLLQNLIADISDKYFAQNKRIEILSARSLREKIIIFLLSEAKRTSQLTFTLSLNRTQLADFINCDRTALCRELSRLDAEGFISFYKNSFKILDKEKLKNILL